MDKQMQVSKSTLYDRYPEVFSAIQEIVYLEGRNNANLNILSYGCSTGEEVKVLHEKYFKSAKITGVDISTESIESAKKLIVHPNIDFKSSDAVKKENSKYDLIFCMSVLCKLHFSNMIEKPIPFEYFNDTIKELYEKLNIGGYLVIYNANYSLFDSDVFDRFVGIRHSKIKKSFNEALMFTKEHNLMFDDRICIYKKIK